MFLIEANSNFKLEHIPNAIPQPDDFVFIYDGNKIGLTEENELPRFKDLKIQGNFYCFARVNHHQCLLHNAQISTNLKFIEAKLNYTLFSKELYQAMAIGCHLSHWRSTHRYCGKCTAPMLDKTDERALICSQCHYTTYPKISPCVIVLITRGEEILLARSPHFPKGMMSALAGFVEVGESVEQTLVREVKEEVGIEVKNLKYICSQPWPFPNSLMLGFIAEYAGGEIKVEPNEIEEARWFNQNNLPLLPSEVSIARYLIESYLGSIPSPASGCPKGG